MFTALSLIDHLWQSTVVVAIVWALSALLRPQAAAVRYRLWLAASLKFLVPFAPLLALGHALGARTAGPLSPSWSGVLEQSVAPVAAASAGAAAVPAVDLTTTVVGGVWFCGVLGVLWSWWRAYRPIREALRRATPAPWNVEGVSGLRVMSTPDLLEPGVVGMFNPVLLLPEGIGQRLGRDHLHAVIAHERCHVMRRDNIAAMLHMAVEALFWFHPAVWWIERHLIEERERACDEAVLDAGIDPHIYAEGILRVCRNYVESGLVCAPGVAGANLSQRIEAIMKNQRRLSLTTGWKLVLAAAALLVAGWPIAAGLSTAPVFAAQSTERASFDPDGPRFTSVSIHANTSGQPSPGGDLYRADGSYRAGNMTLRQLLIQASRLQPQQIIGGPAWLDTDHFDIEAVRELPAPASDGTRSPLPMFEMVRQMLAERFALSLRYELRELPVYALVMARDGRWGPALHRAMIDCGTIDFTKPNPQLPYKFCGGIRATTKGTLVAQSATLPQLAKNLTPLGRIVLDRTGITERVDFSLEWASAPRVEGPIDADFTDSQAVVAALENQLGLTLEPATARVDVLVIDRASKPRLD